MKKGIIVKYCEYIGFDKKVIKTTFFDFEEKEELENFLKENRDEIIIIADGYDFPYQDIWF